MPDLVLGNSKILHNTSITPGPITTSDHIPIIMTITAKAITKPIPATLNTKQANWTQFKEVRAKVSTITSTAQMNKQQIDQNLSKWYNTFEEAINNKIPRKTRQIIQKPITSPLLRRIQHSYEQL